MSKRSRVLLEPSPTPVTAAAAGPVPDNHVRCPTCRADIPLNRWGHHTCSLVRRPREAQGLQSALFEQGAQPGQSAPLGQGAANQCMGDMDGMGDMEMDAAEHSMGDMDDAPSCSQRSRLEMDEAPACSQSSRRSSGSQSSTRHVQPGATRLVGCMALLCWRSAGAAPLGVLG